MSDPRISASISAEDLNKLGAAAGTVLLGRGAGRGLQLALQILLARVLGPAAYGLYALGWTILRLTGLLTPLGLPAGILHFGARWLKRDTPRMRGLILESLALALLAGSFVGGLLFLASPWLAEAVFKETGLRAVLQAFSFILGFYTAVRVGAALTRISERMVYSVWIEDLLQPAANLLLVAGAFALGWRLEGAVAASVLAVAVAFLFGIFSLKRVFPDALSSGIKAAFSLRDVLSYSLPALAAGIFSTLIYWIDRPLVGYFRPAADVGIYQAVSQSSILFAIIVGSFSTITAPMMARFYHAGDQTSMKSVYQITTKWSLYLTLPAFLWIVSAPGEVMALLYGPDYRAGAAALVILIIGQLLNAGTGPVGAVLQMTGQQAIWSRIAFGAFVLQLATSALVVPRWGIEGVAFATALALGGMFLAGVLQIRRSLGFWPYSHRFRKGLLAAGAGAAALWLLEPMKRVMPSALALALLAALVTAVFLAGLALQGLDAEDLSLLDQVRRRAASLSRGKYRP